MRRSIRAIAWIVMLSLLFSLAPFCVRAEETEETIPEPTVETAPSEPQENDLEEFTGEAEEVCEEQLPEEPDTVYSFEEVPLYFQTDYPDIRYAYGYLAENGCSITCLAMVASHLTGYPYMPDVLADYFGGYGENNMQRLEYGSDMLQLPWRKAENFYDAMDALKEGCVVIALMNQNSILTNSQHFVVLTGINEEGRVYVNDPYGPNYDLWNLKDRFRDGFTEGSLVQGFSGAWIYDVSAMPEEPYIYVENKPWVEPRYPQVQLTEEEVDLMARLIWVEARGESAEGQQAIAEVILNRLVTEGFPKTIEEIIFEKNQFPSTAFLEDAEPGQAQYDAIQDALTGPYVLPIDVVHFAQYAENEKVWGQIGGHIFCYGWD